MRLGLTAHSDLTREEFASIYLGSPMTGRPFRGTAQQQKTGPASAAGADATATSMFAPILRKFGLFNAAERLQRRSVSNSASDEQHWRYENVTPPAAIDWRAANPPITGPIKDQHINGTPCGRWASLSMHSMDGHEHSRDGLHEVLAF